MSKTLTFTVIPLLALVIGGGVQISRPIPAARIQTPAVDLKLPGSFSVNFPNRGQVAVGEVSLGVAAKTQNQEPVAIASLTKMMTAYMLLKAKPLKLGEDGPVTTLTAAHVQEYQKDRAEGYSVLKVAAGEKLTERQLLEALLLPSADNIATLIAEDLAGNETEFAKKMNEAARALGMTQTSYADAAGVSNATVSTANDQLLMAREAMKDRTFRDIVAMPQAELPVAGVVYNVNFMIGKQGISGVKTGSTMAAGSCFVGSYPVTVNGTPRIFLCAVLGQVSLREALAYDAATLHAIAPQFKEYAVATPAGGFAQLDTPWAGTTELKPSEPLRVFGYPGMPLTLASEMGAATYPVSAGQKVGSLQVKAGDNTQSVPLLTAKPVPAPGFGWRLSRLP